MPHCVTCVASLCGQLSRRSRWAADASTVQLISALQLPPYIPTDLPVMAEAAPATSLSGDAVPVVPLVDEGHSTALPVVRWAASPFHHVTRDARGTVAKRMCVGGGVG